MTAAALLTFSGLTGAAVYGTVRETGKIERLAASFRLPGETEIPEEELFFVPSEEEQMTEESMFWEAVAPGEVIPETEAGPEEETDQETERSYGAEGSEDRFETRVLEDGTVEICAGSRAGSGPDSELVIPDQIDGRKVTAIAPGAFAGYTSFGTVHIPASVRRIGEGAFAGSTAAAFSVAEGHGVYTAVDGVLFSEKGKVLYAYPSGAGRTYYRIPETVTMIAPGAFEGCNLWRAVLPESLVVIGSGAFRESRELRGIRIPSTVIFIGEGAFAGCPALEKVRWEALTDLVARDMFRGCLSLKEVSLPAWTRSIDEGAFAECPMLCDIRLGSGLQQLGADAFAACPSLKALTLPADLKYIADTALGDPQDQKIVLKVAKGSYSEIWARRKGFSRHAMAPSKFERYLQKTEPSGWEKLDEEQKQEEYKNPEIIRQVQIILNGAGLDCGKADGVAGARTHSAIRTFREERNMEEGDQIDETLLRSMGIEPTKETLQRQ